MAFDREFVAGLTESEMRFWAKLALKSPYRRIAPYRTRSGALVWIKRVERFSPLLWLVKGSPRKAFARDQRARDFLWRRGIPVPALVAGDDRFAVLEDAGPSLTEIQKDPVLAAREKARAYLAAGRALARLHAADLAHGRPAFRDMCWDGSQIRFIDFEYFKPSKAGFLRKARDLGVTLLSALAQGAKGPVCAYWVVKGYSETAHVPSLAFSKPFRSAKAHRSAIANFSEVKLRANPVQLLESAEEYRRR